MKQQAPFSWSGNDEVALGIVHQVIEWKQISQPVVWWSWGWWWTRWSSGAGCPSSGAGPLASASSSASAKSWWPRLWRKQKSLEWKWKKFPMGNRNHSWSCRHRELCFFPWQSKATNFPSPLHLEWPSNKSHFMSHLLVSVLTLLSVLRHFSSAPTRTLYNF